MLLITIGSLLILASGLFPRAVISYAEIDSVEKFSRSSASVTIGTGKASLSMSPAVLAGRRPSFELAGIFNQQYGTASVTIEFPEVQDWSNVDEITFWIYADEAVGQRTNRYIVLDVERPANFAWGLYLFDSEGRYKGIPHVKINWTGWNQIAVPLGSPGRDVHLAWDDTSSLRRLTGVRFDLSLLAESTSTAQNGTIYIGDIQKVSRRIPEIAYLSPLLIILVIVSFMCYIVRSVAPNNLVILIMSAAILLKSILAIVTPLSSDFISSFFHGTPVLPTSSPLDSPLYEGGPFYFSILRGMYYVWSIFPVDHPHPLSIFPGYWSYPALFGRFWWERKEFFHFLATPGSFLLVYLLKLPNIAFDVGSGLLIYSIAAQITGSRSRSMFAAAVWLFNPVTLLIANMWAPVDPAPVFFSLLAVFYTLRQDALYSGISLGLAVATRLAPLVLLPVFLTLLVALKGRHDLRYLSKFSAATLSIPLFALLPTLLGRREIEHIPGIDEPYFLLGPRMQLFETEIALGVVVVFVYYLVLYNIIASKRGHTWRPTSLIPHAVLGLWVTVFAFSKLPFHLLLWVIPFLILDVATGRRSLVYPSLFAASALISGFLITGPYFSTYGHGVFFVPNLFPWMKAVSHFLLKIGAYPMGIGVGIPLMLSRSILAAVAIAYSASILVQISREMGRSA